MTAEMEGIMGMVNFATNVVKTVEIDKTVDLNVNKNVTSFVDIQGCLATAEGSADALGPNALAEVDTFAQCDDSGAYAFAESLAASSDFFLG
jgi:hypothetical protein